MTNEDLLSSLIETFPDTKISEGRQFVEMVVPANQLFASCQKLFGRPEYAFDYMFCITGVDYPDAIQVIYHLESTQFRHTLVVKTRTEGRENPALDSLSPIWHTAKYHEREVYDLLVVTFNNHIDMRRLFLDDSWGFPLRKDYVDEIRIIKR